MTGGSPRSCGYVTKFLHGTVTMLPRSFTHHILSGFTAAGLLFSGIGAVAQDRLPWERTQPPGQQRLGDRDDGDQSDPPPAPYQGGGYGQQGGYNPPPRTGDVYSPQPQSQGGYGGNQVYEPRSNRAQGGAPPANDAYQPPGGGSGSYGTASGDVYRPPTSQGGGYGEPFTPAPGPREPYDRDYGETGPRQPQERSPRYADEQPIRGYYSQNEIAQAGHGFFGSVSRGLASVIEYAFQKAGRPNGYILGEDAGGAFIAGLRYGEGRLHTKDAGTHKVYWQGPSLGYDVGAEGSKTMVLVYNLREPSEIYHRFGGVQGTAYLIGGVSVQFQKYGDVVLAPIRSGIGLRLGANVGYLKYTRNPTWNPF